MAGTVKYRMKPAMLAKHPTAVTQINGVSISLTGTPVVSERKGTGSNPPVKLTSRPATQEELKYLLENENHPFIEKYEE